ncbi:MAG TPA: hypothetical protein VN655_07400 [Pseudolabrys sp.]|nr:hypothetical protein [Pseudolabrys sp.]
MRKVNLPEIVLGALIGIVFALFVVAVGSFQAQQCEAQRHDRNADSHLQKRAASQNKDDSRNEKEREDGKGAKIVCGAIGLPSAIVGYMDRHEGFFVGSFTAFLFFATVFLWLSTRSLTEIGIEEIKLAREEFNSSHRPKIRLKHTWFADNKLGWRAGNPLEITFDFVNIGDGPALITWVVYQSIILKSDERLPQRPPFNEPVPEQYEPWIDHFRCNQQLRPGITIPITVCDGTIVSNRDATEIVQGRKTLYLIGTVQYWDSAGARQTAFCRKLTYPQYPPVNLEPGRFVRVRDPDYDFVD